MLDVEDLISKELVIEASIFKELIILVASKESTSKPATKVGRFLVRGPSRVDVILPTLFYFCLLFICIC